MKHQPTMNQHQPALNYPEIPAEDRPCQATLHPKHRALFSLSPRELPPNTPSGPWQRKPRPRRCHSQQPKLRKEWYSTGITTEK